LLCGCPPSASEGDVGADAAIPPDIQVPDAQVLVLDGGTPAFSITDNLLVAENGRAPSIDRDSRGGLHVAYLCACDPVADGNSAESRCSKICYSRLDCVGIHTVVGPEEGIADGTSAWGAVVSTTIRLDEQDQVFVLKDLRNKQIQHPQVDPNSVHRFDPAQGRFVKVNGDFDAMAILPIGGVIYMVKKIDESEEVPTGIYLAAIDYSGQTVIGERLIAPTSTTAALFVGGMAMDGSGLLHIAYRIDDSVAPKTHDMKEIVFDPGSGQVVQHLSTVNARIGDHHGIAIGGEERELLAVAAPVAWSQGLRVAQRRLDDQAWVTRDYFTDDPRVTWNGDGSAGCDYLNPELAIDKLNRIFVAFGGISQEDVDGQREDFKVCEYQGPCDCQETPGSCFYSINAYVFTVYENGAAGPVELVRPGSTYENYQGKGEGSVELVAAWDQGVFAVYEHLEGFDGKYNLYIKPIGGAKTACGVAIVK
jgi:hypothetical protein